ncbi:hypothetical protein [Chryseobacterium sp. SIMBA_029]|uniref:hypothetical protein n=1 Tax=Chryseobacterium sp. SIMBA_029 TaxID=3085772 RepID=UPI00397BE296
MKKFLTLIGIAAASIAYSQGVLVLNNYSGYDFHGNLLASNLTNCLPMVMNRDPDPIKVPANANMGNGNALVIKDYQIQYTSSLYPISSWNVTLTQGNTTATSWDDASLVLGGSISNNTKWITSKFAMYFPGTNNQVPGFNYSIGDATPNTCYTSTDYILDPNGEVEWFTISTGGTMVTYLQIF